MAAFKVNIALEQGSYLSKRVTWKAGTPYVAVDLTGCTARMQAREDIDDADPPVLDFTTANGHIVLGDAAGTVDIVFEDTDTIDAAWTRLVYDLEIVLANGKPHRLLEGSITLSKEVTR